MSAAEKIASLALELSEKERASLASTLLCSLPFQPEEFDNGLAEAMRRDAELDADPTIGLTTAQLKESLGR